MEEPVVSTGARSAEWRDLLSTIFQAIGREKVSPLRTFGAPVETTGFFFRPIRPSVIPL